MSGEGVWVEVKSPPCQLHIGITKKPIKEITIEDDCETFWWTRISNQIVRKKPTSKCVISQKCIKS